MKAMRRGVSAAAAALVVLAAWAASGSAAVVLEVRAPGDPGPGAVIPVPGEGATIDLELWAVITDASSGGFTSVRGGAWTPGGLVLGESWAEINSALGFLTANNSWHGMGHEAERDIDGDGDPDAVGSTAPNNDAGWMFGSLFFSNTGHLADKIGTIHFGPLTWGPEYNPTGPSGVTKVLPRQAFTIPMDFDIVADGATIMGVDGTEGGGVLLILRSWSPARAWFSTAAPRPAASTTGGGSLTAVPTPSRAARPTPWSPWWRSRTWCPSSARVPTPPACWWAGRKAVNC